VDASIDVAQAPNGGDTRVADDPIAVPPLAGLTIVSSRIPWADAHGYLLSPLLGLTEADPSAIMA
jgi:hypothetical protein